MKQLGLTDETIKRAIIKTKFLINSNGPFTKKQVESIFAASLLDVGENLKRLGNPEGANITERQLEKMFSVDRKTMRKLKKTIRNNDNNHISKPTQLIIYTRQGTSKADYTKVEIPKDLKSVIKLATPKKGKCDFCERQNVLLSWRLSFSNGHLAEICQESLQRLNQVALMENWKIPTE